jgi:hypothetical protein
MPLDEASLIEVKPPSTDDVTRYAKAREIRSREEFAGVSFSDGKGYMSAFSPAEYDQYLAYVREHPEVLAVLHDPKPKWPVVRVAFESSRVLFDPDASSMPTVSFYLCDSGTKDGRLSGFGTPNVMWHDRFVVSSERAREIDGALRQGDRPQTYEIFFDYVYWDWGQKRQKGQPVTLLPLPGDLCLALHRWNYALPSSVGRPLRISKDVINAAVGPLPRQLPASQDNVH